MARDAEPPERSGAPTAPPPATPPPATPPGSRLGSTAGALARKPLVWLTGVVVAALGVTLTNAIAPTFDTLLDPILQRGPAVELLDATSFRSELGESVVFPRSTVFTDADLAELNAQPDPTAWLENRGGVAPGTVFVQLVLAGNRKEPVRIVDLQPVATCAAPLDGVLFEDPPAGSDESIRIDFDLDRPGTKGTAHETDGTTGAPFFPAHTISLASGEQQVLIVTASTTTQSCTVRFALTVLDGGERRQIEVPSADQPGFRVTARMPDPAYQAVYLGGVICLDGFVRASQEYLAGHDPDPCR
ncbi:MAG TPA: hypothetical protein VIT41_03625 [Microlunatus sp.]